MQSGELFSSDFSWGSFNLTYSHNATKNMKNGLDIDWKLTDFLIYHGLDCNSWLTEWMIGYYGLVIIHHEARRYKGRKKIWIINYYFIVIFGLFKNRRYFLNWRLKIL